MTICTCFPAKMATTLHHALRLARTVTTQLSVFQSSVSSASRPLHCRLFSAFSSHKPLASVLPATSCTVSQVDVSKRTVTYDPYPDFEAPSPYKTHGPHRTGYKYKLWSGGKI